MAFYLPDWRDFSFAIGFLTMGNFILYPFYPESPLFLYASGKQKEAERIVKKMGKHLNVEIDQNFLDKMKNNIEKTDSPGTKSRRSPLDLMRTNYVRRVTIFLQFLFVAVHFLYYGLAYRYLNQNHPLKTYYNVILYCRNNRFLEILIKLPIKFKSKLYHQPGS